MRIIKISNGFSLIRGSSTIRVLFRVINGELTALIWDPGYSLTLPPIFITTESPLGIWRIAYRIARQTIRYYS